MNRSTGRALIGISGWRYAPWRGLFYPAGLPQHQELAYASRMLPTLEVNGSFYSLQAPSSWQRWHDATPADFVFSVKGPRYITHLRRLVEVRAPLANFFASGLLLLGPKLGPLLWQFPPSMGFDAARFADFFALLPRDTDQALALARAHDAKLRHPAVLHAPHPQRLRHAVEVRHPSFIDEDFIALLRAHGVAGVVADTAGRWPVLEDLTADFCYLRLHGDQALYASGYSDAALARWADRIDTWRGGGQVADARLAARAPAHASATAPAPRDVFCYFDNDVKVHAPYDAAHLSALLSEPTGMGPVRYTPPRRPARPARPGARLRARSDQFFFHQLAVVHRAEGAVALGELRHRRRLLRAVHLDQQPAATLGGQFHVALHQHDLVAEAGRAAGLVDQRAHLCGGLAGGDAAHAADAGLAQCDAHGLLGVRIGQRQQHVAHGLQGAESGRHGVEVGGVGHGGLHAGRSMPPCWGCAVARGRRQAARVAVRVVRRTMKKAPAGRGLVGAARALQRAITRTISSTLLE